MAPHEALYRALVPVGSRLSSLSSRALGRSYPRWEPDAVTPLVPICGGVMSDHGPYSDFVLINRKISRGNSGFCFVSFQDVHLYLLQLANLIGQGLSRSERAGT